jgi:uncharacterized protein YoxC
MQLLAQLVAHPGVIGSVVGLLIAWAWWSAVRLRSGTRNVARALATARQRIEEAQNPLGFAVIYERVSAELASAPLLGPRWREYRETLLVPTQPNAPVRATSRAELWFDSAALLRAAGMDVRYHAALPNLLVGAGLLFTFFGLMVALGEAGGIVAPGADQDARNNSLRKLLDAASFKFITSLVGLALSIAYALLRKHCLKQTDAALDGFLSALEARVPLITPVALQAEANRLLEKQQEQLETFSTELAVNIGTAFDKAFDTRLGEHIGPLTQAMQELATGMSSRNEDAVRTMLSTFLERLQGGTGDQMEHVAASLAGLAARLEGLQGGLGEAAVRMAESADAMAKRMGEGAEQALSRVTDQMTAVAQSLREVADRTRTAGADAGDRLSARVEEAAKGFQDAAKQVAETLSQAAEAMQQRMGAEAEAANVRLAQQFEAMLGELRSIAEASRKAGTSALDAVAERVEAAAAGFQTTAANVARVMERAGEASGGALGRGAEEAVKRIADATEGMRTELRAMLEELRKGVTDAGEAVRSSATTGGQALRESLDGAGASLAQALGKAAQDLAASGHAAGTALAKGGSEAGVHLQGAATAAAGGIGRLGEQARSVADAAERLSAKVSQLESAVVGAATPLTSGAADMKAAGAAVKDTLQPLRAVAETLRNAMEQVTGAISRLETTQAAGSRLTEELARAAGRFEGVDRELGRTLDELQKGLKGFTTQVTSFVTQTDTNLAKATSHLGAAVKQLEDTLADFLDQVRKR